MTVTNRVHSMTGSSDTIDDSETKSKEYGFVSDNTSGICDKTGVTLAAPRKYELKYSSIVVLLYFHYAAFNGLCRFFTSAKIATIIFDIILVYLGGFGITGGAHRLWTHRTYKVKRPFEYLLMLCNCIGFQQAVIYWVRDHRLHHKYSDTDADPHNARRGFFYSHIGWLCVKKSDIVKERGKTIDLSDIENNPVLQFQKKYAFFLFGLACFVLPTLIPVLCWGETLSNAYYLNMLRYMINLHASLSVNSFTHMFGYRPYDKNILPTENRIVSVFSGGEGFHNYHHSFPWDYRTAELGNNFLNVTTRVLDFFAKFGWVYDMKTAKPEMIIAKAQASGDVTKLVG
ncbi:acyl-CoA Delta(11) desaturase-like [Epargyreus clarus]|uniref:acyl-CoA Delta(11) desaturase-like n=1 Tax=Epargyreus clarus TaxID=520877 RepID=UPI003C2F2181